MKTGMKVTQSNLPIVIERLMKLLQGHASVRFQTFYTNSLENANRIRIQAIDSQLSDRNGKTLASQAYNKPIFGVLKIRPKKTIGISIGTGPDLWTKKTLLMMGELGWNFFTLDHRDRILFQNNQVIVLKTHDIVTKEKCIVMFDFC